MSNSSGRDAILQAAQELFTPKGFAATIVHVWLVIASDRRRGNVASCARESRALGT
jgi:hypothetical protein